MINKAIISNFQSHEKSEFDFAPGVNVIIGETDSGKTAVIRALHWIINNKPGGESFIRTGQKECSVIVDDIEKRKGAENLYIKGKEEYKAFGANVPDDIKKYFNFSELNMQYQMDAPFLLSNSAGEVARFLNKIVDLDSIDVALKEIESKKKAVRSIININDGSIDDTKDDLKKYKNLDSISDFITGLDVLENKQNKKIEEKQIINYLIEVVLIVRDKLDKIKIPDISIEDLIKESNIISEKVTESDYLNFHLIHARKLLHIQDMLKIPDIDIDSLTVENNLLTEELMTVEKLKKINYEITELAVNIEGNKIVINAMEKEFKELMPEQCPLCGSKI